MGNLFLTIQHNGSCLQNGGRQVPQHSSKMDQRLLSSKPVPLDTMICFLVKKSTPQDVRVARTPLKPKDCGGDHKARLLRRGCEIPICVSWISRTLSFQLPHLKLFLETSCLVPIIPSHMVSQMPVGSGGSRQSAKF